MDQSNYATHQEPLVHEPATWHSADDDRAAELMRELKLSMERLNRGDPEAVERAHSLQTYTITQAAHKTGRPRAEIDRMVRRGDIDSRMAPGGAPLRLIPAREIKRLMPDDTGEKKDVEPADGPPGSESNY